MKLIYKLLELYFCLSTPPGLPSEMCLEAIDLFFHTFSLRQQEHLHCMFDELVPK